MAVEAMRARNAPAVAVRRVEERDMRAFQARTS